MPTVTFPLEYLQRLTQTQPEQIVQQAFNYGLEATLFEHTLDVDVTAERPDLLSAEGFTRAINIYSGNVRSVPDRLEASGRQIRVDPSVAALRPHIAALVVENANLGAGGLEVLVQFQEKVTQTFGRQRKKIAIGVYDLDQISGNLIYTSAPKGQLQFLPLNAEQPMTAAQILTQHPAGKLYSHTLPEGDRVPVLLDANHQVLSLPPIINAAGVGEVSDRTRNLLIDVTGILPQTVLETINILAHNFIDTGATVKTVDIINADHTLTTPQMARRPIQFSAKYLNEIMGSAIPKHALGNTLSRMDLQVTGTDVVLIPTYRTDIFSQVDLAGDLMVALGVENLRPDPTAVKFYTGSADTLKSFVFRVGDLAQRMGLMEVKNFVLTDPYLLSPFPGAAVQADNAKSRTHSAMRTTLQAGLLNILSHNINAPKPINVYETGAVLRLEPDANPVNESMYWGFASLDARASFTIAKSYVQTLLKALNIDFDLIPYDADHYIAGRAATVLIDGKTAGQFGEIAPAVLEHFSFPEPVCAGELDCCVLVQYASPEALPRFSESES
ncbi:MAG: phenylalanine--tRNA ligase subunit beta [Cyanobacteria bacterium P01_D01_bin.128]